MSDFTLPELGENISAGDVLRVLVKPGDPLSKDQPVLELETDKATIEVPSSVAGTVGDIGCPRELIWRRNASSLFAFLRAACPSTLTPRACCDKRTCAEDQPVSLRHIGPRT